ncbi:MAG: chloride channel protein [Gammaproteobacteria bacterium]|nr:MAG: chloride channel protein [Gammaproteobacteria bacterium]
MGIDLDNIRQRLSHIDAVPLLSLLGILAGLASGGMILLFRFTIDGPLMLALNGNPENFESLSAAWRFALPVAGAALLSLMFFRLPKYLTRTGVAHVIERFHLHQGVLSARGLIVQFFGAAISLMSGHSMGREGPAVHIGASTSSLIGQWAGLPNNSLRVLVGCGVAAGISASFNTPLAGVIFAMEVVMLEYSIATFTPIILASVVGAMMMRAVYGHDVAFEIPTTISVHSLQEIPFLLISGLLIGCVASAFIFGTHRVHKLVSKRHVFIRFISAGTIVGICGLLVPEILGTGYDTVNHAVTGQIAFTSLLLICTFKLVTSSICVASGLPAGVIGPCLMIGACAGGAIGLLVNQILPGTDPGLYVMIGMAAMMAATLQAPLAALMALLELTANHSIIFPGMLVVVIASLISSHLFKQKNIFQTILAAQGIELKSTALERHLHSAAVPSLMERSFKRSEQKLAYEDALTFIDQKPSWILIEDNGVPKKLLHAVDLVSFMQNKETKEKIPKVIDLMHMPASRLDVVPVLMSATLKEALDAMDKHSVDAVYVRRMNAPNIYRIFGVLTRQDIERFYKI